MNYPGLQFIIPHCIRFGAYAFCALPLAAVVVYAKIRWLEMGGYVGAAAMDGRTARDLNTLERLSLLQSDLLTVLIAIPVLTILISRVLPDRWRALGVGAVLTIFMILFYAQTRSLASVGTHLHFNMAISAIRFGWERPEFIRQYLPIGGVIKTLGAIAMTFVGALLIRRTELRLHRSGLRRVVARLELAALLIVIVVCSAASAESLPPSSYEKNLFLRAMLGYVRTGEVVDARFRRLSDGELQARYRAIARIPASPVNPLYYGRAAHHNLITFVLESVPQRCLDATGDLQDLPNLARLRRSAFTNRRHFTTYPYSSLANFASVSGWYPPSFARAYTERNQHKRVPSIYWDLRERKYHIALYEPFGHRFENDAGMYRMLGVERQVVPGVLAAGSRPSWSDIARADSAALRVATDDIDGWLTRGERFAILFMPQISHGPWHDPIPDRKSPELLERCRSLVAIQDGWIGSMIRVLERHGALDKTIILITSDHGVRTAQEDPRFRPGILSDYSFNVPFLMYAPAVLDSTYTLDVVTSSIDVAPTLRDLFGIERIREREQGNTIWDPALPARVTFMLASSYFGADGFHDGGRFYAWSSVTGSICVSQDELACDAGHLVGLRTPLADSVRRTLRHFRGLQYAWLNRFAIE